MPLFGLEVPAASYMSRSLLSHRSPHHTPVRDEIGAMDGAMFAQVCAGCGQDDRSQPVPPAHESHRASRHRPNHGTDAGTRARLSPKRSLETLAGFDDAAVQLAVMAQLKTLLKLASRGDANVRRLHRPAAAAAAVVALAESSSAIGIGLRQRGCAAAGSKRSAVVAVPRRREPQAHRADRRRRPRRRACAHFPLRRTSHLRALPPRTLARSQPLSLTMPRTDACGWPAASFPSRRGWARRFRS